MPCLKSKKQSYQPSLFRKVVLARKKEDHKKVVYTDDDTIKKEPIYYTIQRDSKIGNFGK